MPGPKKRVLVCGAGSIGRRHIANLLKLGTQVSVWRSRAALLDDVAQEFGVRTHQDLSYAIEESDAVVVATATDQHVPLARRVLETGRAVFIEKPLSHDWAGIDDLLQLSGGRVVEVGCQFRAHPNLIALARALAQPKNGRSLTYRLAMGQRLDAWRAADYRDCYSADAARGGGALFDLVHLIDIALWLFGPVASVYAVLSKMGELEIRGDDVANLLLTHNSGVTGQVQLDMASPVHRCEIEVMTAQALYTWSNAQGAVRRQSETADEVVHCVDAGFERNDLFMAHTRHFLARVENPGLEPLCSLDEGVDALRVALTARASDSRGARVAIDEAR